MDGTMHLLKNQEKIIYVYVKLKLEQNCRGKYISFDLAYYFSYSISVNVLTVVMWYAVHTLLHLFSPPSLILCQARFLSYSSISQRCN